MTKFILHGGVTRRRNVRNRNFYAEMLKGEKEPLKILLVFFARYRKQWKESAAETEMRFRRMSKKKLIFTIADPNEEKLARQIKENDVIYLAGGWTLGLYRRLKPVKNLKKLFNGKVVAGSSAGAIVLSKYYYDQDHGRIFDGLGFLPVKMITHYKCRGEYADESGEDKLNLLENHKEKLPIYAIRETEFVVVEK